MHTCQVRRFGDGQDQVVWQAGNDGIFADEGMPQCRRMGDIALEEIDALRHVQWPFPVHPGHVHTTGTQQAGYQGADATKAEDKRVCDCHTYVSSHR
jgi:hypothetical protein